MFINSGNFLRGGVPDTIAAARSLLNDWNTGKIKYCTQPPVDSNDVHISASIVKCNDAREFDIDNFHEMETDILNKFDNQNKDDIMMIESNESVKMELDNNDCGDDQVHIIESTETKVIQKPRGKQNVDAVMLLEGMLKIY